MASSRRRVSEWDEMVQDAFYFHGATSLAGHKFLPTKSLPLALRSLGLNPPNAKDWRQYLNQETPGQTRRRFREIDGDGNGRLDFDDFQIIVRHKKADEDTPQELLSAFEVFDVNQNGLLETAELRHILSTLGAGKLTTVEIEQLLREADREGRGTVDYKRFVQNITSLN